MKYESDYLMHYGVLGMKWGVRRYQNEDGTRTPLGKRRERQEYGESLRDDRYVRRQEKASKKGSRSDTLSKLNDQTIKGGKDKPNKSPAQVLTKESENIIINATDILKAARKKKPNRAKDMSDEDLRKIINRLRMENEYNNLTNVEDGMDRVIDALQIIGTVAAIGTSAAVMAGTIKALKK